ncbi:MAG: ABC transporter permease [Anaerolineae bacterium]|nr:MAG: ABC transporter permease [Anaerolineae bacterium]
MWAYVGKRIIQMMITLLLFQAATFALLELQPIDIADLLTGNPDIPPAERDRLRAELGLDRPPVERFISYVGNFYRGNLGVSFSQYPRAVSEIIVERLPRTLVLFVSAVALSYWAGYVTGKYLAWRRGGFVEYGATLVGVTLYTVFLPWFALMMIWLFAVYLDLLPAGKFLDPLKWLNAEVTANSVFLQLIWSALLIIVVAFIGFLISSRVEHRYRKLIRIASIVLPFAGVIFYWSSSGIGELAWDITKHTILPVLTLTLVAFGGSMLLMRTSMLETVREDYILSARAKGLPDNVIRDKHAARNALLPLWTGLVFAIGAAVGGGIITEAIFSWPGLGRTLLNASLVNDVPLAMGALTVIGVLTLVSHLVADIGYVFLDPRIRY